MDVMLMDVQMPVLDGCDATLRICNGLGLKELPIIALTAGITTGKRERGRTADMNDVAAKPLDPQALGRCIRKYVQRLMEIAGTLGAKLVERLAAQAEEARRAGNLQQL